MLDTFLFFPDYGRSYLAFPPQFGESVLPDHPDTFPLLYLRQLCFPGDTVSERRFREPPLFGLVVD